MAKSKTTLKPGDNLPPRGRNKQTLILEAVREAAVLGLDSDSTKQEAEVAMFRYMAQAAFNPTEETADKSSFCLGILMKKGWADLKSVMPCVEFDFDVEATPAVQASQIMKASADGFIPPDVANTFISSIASMLKIDEVTEIQERLAELEAIVK